MSTSFTVFDSEWTDEEQEHLALLALLKEKLSFSPIVNTSLHEYTDLSGKTSVVSSPFEEKPFREFRAYAILDEQDRMIAYTTLDDLHLNHSEWLIYAYPDADTLEQMSGRMLEEARKLADGAIYLTHAYANPDEAAPQWEVPLEKSSYEAITNMPDGSTRKDWVYNCVIKEADLPPVAQTATHRTRLGIRIFIGDNDPAMYATMPVASRLSYMMYNTGLVNSTGMGYGEKTPWESDVVFLDPEYETNKGVGFLFLEDGNGRLLAYTSYYTL